MQQIYICEISYNYQRQINKQFGEIFVDMSGKLEGDIVDTKFDRPYRKISGGTFIIDGQRFIDYLELRLASRYPDKHHIFFKNNNIKIIEGEYQGRWILEREMPFEADELENTANLTIKLKET